MKSLMANVFWYYHRQKWFVNALLEKIKEVSGDDQIVFNKPIFMVGLQGAGETFLGRVIMRSPEVVSVSGDHNYWFGPDEMHTVLGPILHKRFTGQLHKVPRRDLYGRRRGWAYASDELLTYYKLDESDVDEHLTKNLNFALRVIGSFGNRSKSRIFDKSQSYALKIPAIRKILASSDPRFVAVTRNPVVSIYRASCITTHLHKEPLPIERRVEVAAQHWNNTISRIRQAQEEFSGDIMVVQIEKCLREWPTIVPRIFSHIELDFDESLLPSESDSMPWWAKRADRWFPVKREINNKYLAEVPSWIVERVDEVCGENAHWAGYNI